MNETVNKYNVMMNVVMHTKAKKKRLQLVDARAERKNLQQFLYKSALNS